MLLEIDVPTTTVVGIVLGISISCLMLLNWHIQKRQRGVALWALGFVLGAIGMVLVGLRAVLPAWLSVTIANTLLNAFWLLIWIGLRRFHNRMPDGWLVALLLLTAQLGGILYFLHATPSISARIVVFCLTSSLAVGLCSLEFFSQANRKNRTLYLIGGGAGILHIIYCVIRIAITVSEGPIDNLLTAGWMHRLSFIEGMALAFWQAFCLVMASAQRSQSMLELYQEKLENLASTDALSGLGNRRHFMDAASREIDRARRHERSLSLIMLDLDHFKYINDNHGHQCGDEVIKSVGLLLRQELREHDIICRIGGEEFALLLPESTAATAAEVAERLRAIQASHKMPYGENIEVSCTACFGVTELREGDVTIYDMLPRADQALYAAKKAGRNRVMVSGQSMIADMIAPMD